MKMNSNTLTPRFLVLAGMVFIAAFSRLIPHPPNFTAVAAIALFGGAYFSRRYIAFILPLIALFITDLIIGFHNTMWAVYLSFVLVVIIGMGLKNKKKIGNIFLASVSASVLFFIVSNFAVWLAGGLYPKTAEGLLLCYTAAIPFFHYNLLGDLLFVGVLFGTFELAKAKFPKLAQAKV
jgi:hypothetical protein